MTLPKPKAVLFDWDDTIVSGISEIVAAAMKDALSKMGRGPLTEEEKRALYGRSARDQFQALFGDKWEEADRHFFAAYLDNAKEKLEIYPGAEAVLKLLKDNGIYAAVVSTKRGHLLRREAEQSGLAPYFGKIIGAGDAAADKPDAAPVRLALEGSGIVPGADVWFIGDTMADIRCARAAGCTSLLIEHKLPPEDQLQKEPPDRRVASHPQLVTLIQDFF